MEFVDFFDYNQITVEQKKAVSEVAKWLKTVEGNERLAKKALVRFKVEERKQLSVNDSIFYQYAQKFGLFCNVQGFTNTDMGYDIPHCSICANTNDLDAFFHWAVKTRMEEMTEEEIRKSSGMLKPGERNPLLGEDQLKESTINPNIQAMYEVDESAQAMLDDIRKLEEKNN